MNDREAAAVLSALDSGRQFIFEAYTADARETLVLDRDSGRYLLRIEHAFDPGASITESLSRGELLRRLKARFDFRDFRLPRPNSRQDSSGGRP